MLVAVIITIVLAIAVFLFFRKYFPKSKPNSPPNSLNGDWTGTLNLATQRHTVEEYCHLKGYNYRAPLTEYDYGGCLYTEDTCIADSNPNWVSCTSVTGGGIDSDGRPCNPDQRPYLEWHTPKGASEGMCMVSAFPPAFIQQICHEKGLGDWYPGRPVCDSSGYCQINPQDPPTCKISSGYCDKMGLDHENHEGLGDCNLSDLQNIFEGVVGRTVTRSFKKTGEAMVQECKSDLFSSNCAVSILNSQLTLIPVALDTANELFIGYMKTLKDKCSGDIFTNPEKFYECSKNILPMFYLQNQATEFMDSMLDGALQFLPFGLPTGLLQKANGLLFKYGFIALNSFIEAGKAAIHAFEIAGDAFFYVLNHIGLGPVGDLIRGIAGNVIKFGRGICNIVINVAKEALSIFVNDLIPAAYHVFEAVVGCVLHPKEFFIAIGNNIAAFFRDPIGSIKSAIKVIADIGAKVWDLAKKVISRLVDLAKELGGLIADTLRDIANTIREAFESVGNKIEDVANEIKDFFSNLF